MEASGGTVELMPIIIAIVAGLIKGQQNKNEGRKDCLYLNDQILILFERQEALEQALQEIVTSGEGQEQEKYWENVIEDDDLPF